MSLESSVVLITSVDKDNPNFGTGFTIDQNGGYSYILTCAHVVRKVMDQSGKVKVNGVIAEKVPIDDLNQADDLAVLRVKELFGVPLPRRSKAEVGSRFTSVGYQRVMATGMTKSVMRRQLQGTLDELTDQQIVGQSFHTKLWALKTEGGFAPQAGYSGAPIIQEGYVIGVLSMVEQGKFFAISIEALSRILPEPLYVPFTNREDELKLILSSSAPAYYLLDGPSGYGKSTLLGELQNKFSERQWSCGYLILDRSLELDELAEAVAEKMCVSSLLSKSTTNQDAGFRLGRALRAHWDTSKSGIVLLFDFDKKFSNFELLERLLNQLIPQIEESLKSIAPFNQGDNRFRVIIAGRYLCSFYNRLSVQPLPVIPRSQSLTPFKYDVIQDSARIYLKNHGDKRTKEIAHHILYLTGGHPGCMAQLLQEYEKSGMLPETFVNTHSVDIWNEIVKPVVNDIAAEFPTTKGVHKLMRKNVLRYMDYTALRNLADILEIPTEWGTTEFDEFNLSDILTGAALLSWNNKLLHDDITHRLVCLGLRNDNSDEFVELCQTAKTICIERLRDISNPNPEKWAIEYLFQFLQQQTLSISNPEQRRALRHNFLTDELPKVLRWLHEGRKEQEQRRFLLDSIEKDWEFMFTVNYYLRDAEYNDEPGNELKSRVKGE